MKIGVDCYEGIETVGELIEVLSSFNPELPLEVNSSGSVTVSLMADYETRVIEYVDIDGD
ncbi:TPA: hypothetical protein ACK21Z_003181 [Vibrio harveyi]|nr:hypothetical protein [Vibrio harveyi]HDZ3734278.1 hypothetical protein [Vibrio harveyi]